MLQAGCHKDCLKEDVQRCVVGWPDGSCGGQPKGVWGPAKERAGRKPESQHISDTQGPPTLISRVGGIPVMKLNDGKRR